MSDLTLASARHVLFATRSHLQANTRAMVDCMLEAFGIGAGRSQRAARVTCCGELVSETQAGLRRSALLLSRALLAGPFRCGQPGLDRERGIPRTARVHGLH